MRRNAVFDASKRYRYRLGREWDATLPRVTFVLLNPSTADHRKDDPTIRRCIGFARAWGYGGVEVLNLFAWRATKPKDLRRAVAPVGPANDRHLRDAVRRSARVIVAWGIHGAWQNRDQAALALLRRHGCTPFCLGLTRDGLPRHVLYLRHETSPTEYPSDARR
ncbi:MAG TPA: DUF1643 domain-containing protein [bacterium]